MKIRLIIMMCLGFTCFEAIACDSIVDLTGKARYDNITYFNHQDGKINGRNEGLLHLKLSSPRWKTAGVQWKVVAKARKDISDKTRNQVFLDELLIKKKFNFADITLGKQIIGWGTADGMNPVDNINPVDFRDILDTEEEKSGIYGIRSQLFFDSFDIDLILIPVFSAGKLPQSNSRWFPSLSSMGINSNDVGVEINQNVPGIKLKNGGLGLRIRKRFSGIDLAVSHYYGYDYMPELEVAEFITEPEPTLLINSNFFKQNVSGIEMFVALPKGISLRAESAFFNPIKTTFSTNSYIKTVAGIDKNIYFDRFNLLVLFQYLNDQRVDGAEYQDFDFRHVFRNSIVSGLDFSFFKGLNIKSRSVWNLYSGDFIFRPEIGYLTPEGNIRLILRLDFMHGKQHSFFGSYSHNNRIQFKAEYLF